MKKIIYSPYSKFIAVLLLTISVMLGANSVVDSVRRYYNEEEGIYGFEESFDRTSYFTPLLHEPMQCVNEAYSNFYEGKSDALTFEDCLNAQLDNLQNSEKLNYFIIINGKAYTNCNASGKDDFKSEKFFLIAERDANGNFYYSANDTTECIMDLDNIPKNNDSVTVCASIKPSYAEKCKNIWRRQSAVVRYALTSVLIFAATALLLLIYLIAVCGKNKDGKYKQIWPDRIWTEVHLIIIGISALCAPGFSYMAMEYTVSGYMPLYAARTAVLVLSASGTLLLTASLLSVIRKLKCRNLVGTSVVCRLIKRIWKAFVTAAAAVRKCLRSIFSAAPKKTTAILASILFVYTAVIGVCSIFIPYSFFALLFVLVLFGFGCFAIAYRSKDIEEIMYGANEIRNGNLSYKITELKSDDLKVLADDINEIATGLENSVSEKLKAERLKTEIITNVSHDLNTPLTSIISYTELLSKVENLPEDAADYIRIIAKKSDRLKNITQDLFDISKVQSGSDNIVFEKLDTSILINQALAEHDNEIKDSGLPFYIDVQKELYISADGRKMSRVVSNLISNILKYTLKNTRVFITAFEKNGEAVIEFKNIASYPMEFNAEEITGRFVRGDEARTTDGSGLGLAIAKTYTEACGGTFRIVTDGDLFKAIIKFRSI